MRKKVAQQEERTRKKNEVKELRNQLRAEAAAKAEEERQVKGEEALIRQEAAKKEERKHGKLLRPDKGPLQRQGTMFNSAGSTQKLTIVTDDKNGRKKVAIKPVIKRSQPPRGQFVAPAWARHAVPNKRPTKRRAKKPDIVFATDAPLEVDPSTGLTSYVYELESANKEPFVIESPAQYVFEST